MERQLGVFETAETLTDEYAPFNVVIALRLSGRSDEEGLRPALDLLQHRHPLLGVHLVKQGAKFFYEREGTPAIPLEIEESGGAGAWAEAVERELNRAFDTSTGPLVRCLLLRSPGDENRCCLILSFHHAIIDSAGVLTVVRQLLDAWNDPEFERGSLVEKLPMMPPLEELFPAAFKGLAARRRLAGFFLRQMADEIGYRWNARGTRIPSVHDTAQCRIVCRDHGGEDLDALVRSSRRHRVTLHSAANAAFLLAVQNQLHEGKAVPLRNFNFAVLRRYLEPPVEGEHLGSYHAMLRYTTALGRDEDFWELAVRINAQVHKVTRRGDKFCFPLMSATLMRMILRQKKMRMSSTALAYTGPTQIGLQFGATTIQEMHGFVSNLVLGPEYTAQARLFRGRLWWDLVYLDSDMDAQMAEAIADEILERLHDAARR